MHLLSLAFLSLSFSTLAYASPAARNTTQIPAAKDTTQLSAPSYDNWITKWPEHFQTHHESSLLKLYNISYGLDITEPPTSDIVRRDDMFKGKQYRIAGWFFSISFYVVEEWPGTTWTFPRNNLARSITYISDQLARDVTQVVNDHVFQRNIGGGWSWSGHVGDHYQFKNIPYDVIFDTCFDAITGAVDWITWENGATWQLLDTAGDEIAAFSLYPTNANRNAAPQYVHEF